MSAGDKSHDNVNKCAGTALCFEVLGFYCAHAIGGVEGGDMRSEAVNY
jgi:hypothetical protein